MHLLLAIPFGRLRFLVITTIAAFACWISLPVHAAVFSFDFEGQPSGATVGATYAGQGLTFTGATFASAGIDLNEAEFPPKSGVAVLLAGDSGVISASLSKPASAIGAYFTYAMDPGQLLTLTAYASTDLSGTPLFSVSSQFTENFVGNGDPNPLNQPNELLSISLGTPQIRSFIVQGTAVAGAFAMDNLSFTAVPEPGVIWAASFLAAFGALRLRWGDFGS